MPGRPVPCDLADPGWGIPGFPWYFCCFTHSLVWPGDLELDGHVLGTLRAVTIALLTNRLDLCGI